MPGRLEIGAEEKFVYRVPPEKTVRHIYREAREFQDFPDVFATGFMVALMEWTCVRALHPTLQPGEGSLGVGVNVTHEAATPPGFEVTVTATLREVDDKRRRFTWEVVAHDGVDIIGRGRHERAVIRRDRFAQKLAEKTKAGSQP